MEARTRGGFCYLCFVRFLLTESRKEPALRGFFLYNQLPMTIIFDYNRTIYDPETGTLVEGALEALASFAQTGVPMHLVSKLEPGREEALDALGIRDYFVSIAFVEDKEDAMRAIVESVAEPVYVIGDHLHNEIRIGNKLGARTVWLARGKFAGLRPEEEHDVPWRTIKHFKELPSIFD